MHPGPKECKVYSNEIELEHFFFLQAIISLFMGQFRFILNLNRIIGTIQKYVQKKKYLSKRGLNEIGNPNMN